MVGRTWRDCRTGRIVSAGVNDPFAGCAWLNPPANSTMEANGTLAATSGAKTDFWRHTHYGFVRDGGHAYLCPRNGEFSATLRFSGAYETLYDQAGLMVRSGTEDWIKFGIELTDRAPHLSVVVTHGVSDWSARPLPAALNAPVTVRITRIGDAMLLQSLEGENWHMERLAPWPVDPADISVGPFLCSPQRAGFTAHFSRFEITDPVVRTLHA